MNTGVKLLFIGLAVGLVAGGHIILKTRKILGKSRGHGGDEPLLRREDILEQNHKGVLLLTLGGLISFTGFVMMVWKLLH